MTSPVMALVDRARGRVAAERARAARAAQVAARHEALAAQVPQSLRQFHQNAASTHRTVEARHLVAAGIQASHLARLRSWATSVTDARPAEVRHPTYDALTRLPDRTLFATRLGQALRDRDDWGPRRVGVCFIDLDNFKVINDRLGHEIGDHLLVALAERLSERIPGRLLARLGGDEFALLLEDTSEASDATKVAETALAGIREPVHVDHHDLRVSASIGVVERPVAGADPVEIMRAADTTLSWAKSGGRDCWALYDRDRDDRTQARYSLAVQLPTAIEAGEFFLEFQPVVALTDGSVSGAEALVRWRHPDLGVLYPDRFLGLAEESGLIARMGHSVLEQACTEAAKWGRLTPNPPFIAVNVVARQIREADFVHEVTTVLARTGVEPSRLKLEITEGSVVHPDDQSLSVLRGLAEIGVSVAIDDFGTGYSNLSYLRLLPVDTLKIDRSFVAGVRSPGGGIDPTGEQVLSAMVSLAHVLGLTVTAEGVEERAQAEALRSIGCEWAQGWYFGRPVSADEFEALIAR